VAVLSAWAGKYEQRLGLRMLEYLYGEKFFIIGSGYFRTKPFPYILKTSLSSYLPAYEDGTTRVFRNVGI